jgi:hypothetical protein
VLPSVTGGVVKYCECWCVCCDTQAFILPDHATGEGIHCPSCGRQLRPHLLSPMQEAEWLAHKVPTFLAQFDVVQEASERKHRLFACACCRLLWDAFPEQACREAAAVGERFADGAADPAELARAREAARQVALSAAVAGEWAVTLPALAAGLKAPSPESVVRFFRFSRRFSPPPALAGRAPQVASLIRDLFGNPFRPVAIDPAWQSWHNGLIPSMARRMYDSRDFADLPILADALEDAGCSDPAVLDHCRRPGLHARGCWLIDSLLDRA